MSIEDINKAAAAQNALTARINGFMNDADAEIGAIAARYNSPFSYAYVDQAVGNDANAGTTNSPVATIGKAIDLIPVGSVASIFVRGDYTTTKRYSTKGKNIRLYGAEADFTTAAAGAYPTLTIGVSVQDGWAYVNGFPLDYGSFINISNMNVVLPSTANLSAEAAAASANTTTKALFPITSSSNGPAGRAMLRYGDLTVPADSFATLFSNHVGFIYNYAALTVTGDLAGYIHPAVAAGTTREAAAHLIQTDRPTL